MTYENATTEGVVLIESLGPVRIKRSNLDNHLYFEVNDMFGAGDTWESWEYNDFHMSAEKWTDLMEKIEDEYNELYSEILYGATPKPSVVSGEFEQELMSLKSEVAELKKDKQKTADAIVESIINKGKEVTVDRLVNTATERLDEFIQKTYGALPKKLDLQINDGKPVEIEGIFHKKFEMLMQIVARKVPVMLVGPAGSGKNHTLEQIAEAMGLTFYFTNAVTQEHKLTGFIDANGKFHDTQFYQAFTNGFPVSLLIMLSGCNHK